MAYDRDFIPGVGGRRSGGDRFLRRRVLTSVAKMEIKEAFAGRIVVLATSERRFVCRRRGRRRPSGSSERIFFFIRRRGGRTQGARSSGKRASTSRGRGRERIRDFGNGFRKNLSILILRGRFRFFSSGFSASSRSAGMPKSSTVVKSLTSSCEIDKHGASACGGW